MTGVKSAGKGLIYQVTEVDTEGIKKRQFYVAADERLDVYVALQDLAENGQIDSSCYHGVVPMSGDVFVAEPVLSRLDKTPAHVGLYDLLREITNPGDDELRLDGKFIEVTGPAISFRPYGLCYFIDLKGKLSNDLIVVHGDLEDRTNELVLTEEFKDLSPAKPQTVTVQGVINVGGDGEFFIDASYLKVDSIVIGKYSK